MTNLDDFWESLAFMLRDELVGYGGLFSILEAQRASLLEQDMDAIIGANRDLEKQADKIQDLRDRRLNFLQSCGEAGEEDSVESLTIKKILRKAPEKFRPMFDGLVDEIERLMTSTRNYLKRNQMLMRRAYDMNRQFLSLVGQDGDQSISYRRNGALENPRHQLTASTYLARA